MCVAERMRVPWPAARMTTENGFMPARMARGAWAAKRRAPHRQEPAQRPLLYSVDQALPSLPPPAGGLVPPRPRPEPLPRRVPLPGLAVPDEARDRDVLAEAARLRGAAGFAAAPSPDPVLADDFRALVARAGLAALLVPELPPLLAELERARVEPLLLAVDEVARWALERPPLLRESLLAPVKISPDRTRCAASATASAINAPSLATELPALLAVSAASVPASRIFLRTVGDALIAAAAAARPAASISLLIAALASLSSVSSAVVERLEPPDCRLLAELAP